ncbi:MAG TPA: MFS transporter [Solirubrobacteraceae bacterium]|jgi:hypothetical protein|nr:MFS transporter [Solirubrobacteraceae bacterium]
MLDLRPLHSVGFRHIAAASLINEFGNWVGEIALAILVYDRTHSPLATAVLFVSLRFLPALLAPLLTTRVEVIPPRFALTTIFLFEAALFAVIAQVTEHRFSMPLVLALVAADGVLAITGTALARTVLATGLIRDGLLREGNSLLNLGAMVAVAGAPAVAGIVSAGNGAVDAVRIDAASFLVAAVILGSATKLELHSDEGAGFVGRLQAGLGTLRTDPTVRRLLIAISLVIGLGAVAVPIEVVFATHTLHAGDIGYGLLLTSWGAGMIIGALAFAGSRETQLMTILGVSTVCEAVGYAGMAAAPSLVVACLFSCVGGIGNGAAWVAARTAMQQRLPVARQAAVMSVLEASNQITVALGFMAGGAVTALTSPRLAYAISAAGVAAVVAAFTVWPIDVAGSASPEAVAIGDRSPGGEDTELQDNPVSGRRTSLPPATTR